MCGSVGLLFLICSFAGSSLACDTSRIVQCQTTFLNALGFSDGMSSQEMNVLNGLRSTEKVNLVCTAFQSFKQCFDPLISGCTNGNDMSGYRLTRVVSNIYDMYDYICNTGRTDVVRYWDCWASETVTNEAVQCTGQISMTASNYQDLCANLYKVLTCMGDIVYRHCGARPATVYSTIMSYSLQMISSATGETCQTIKQTFGTVGKNPYENGRAPSNASRSKPMNYAFVIYIAMLCLISLIY